MKLRTNDFLIRESLQEDKNEKENFEREIGGFAGERTSW